MVLINHNDKDRSYRRQHAICVCEYCKESLTSYDIAANNALECATCGTIQPITKDIAKAIVDHQGNISYYAGDDLIHVKYRGLGSYSLTVNDDLSASMPFDRVWAIITEAAH